MAGLEDIVGKTGNYTVRDKFKRFDNRFIRPYLIRDHKVSANLFAQLRIIFIDPRMSLNFPECLVLPLFCHRLQGAEPKIIETYSKLTMRDAIEVMRRNPSTLGQMSGTESMSALFRNYTFAGRSGVPSMPSMLNTW